MIENANAITTTLPGSAFAVDTASPNMNQEILRDMQDFRGVYASPVLNDGEKLTSTIANEAFEMMSNFEYVNMRYYQPFCAIFREDMDYYNSHQYSAKDAATILSQKRKPYVMDQIRKFVDEWLSEQRTMRTETRLSPLSPISEDYTEMMNHYLRWVHQSNHWDDTVSDVNRDNIVGGLGVVGGFLECPYESPVLEQIFPLECMWDYGTARNTRLDDSSFCWRGRFAPTSEIIDQFPWARDIINRNSGQMDRYMLAWYTIKRPKISAPANSLTLDTTFDAWNVILNRNMVFTREFYHRRYEPRWVVRDGLTGCDEVFEPIPGSDECPQDAIDFMKASIAFYMEPAIQQLIGNQQPRISMPFRKSVAFVDKYVFAGIDLIYKKTYQTSHYPYKALSSTYYYGEMTSLLEMSKGPQRFFNRLFMYADEKLGGPKSGVMINTQGLIGEQGEWQLADIQNYMTQTNPVWGYNMEADEWKGFEPIKTYAPPPNSGLESSLMNLAGKVIEANWGGANVAGGMASSAQSGKSAASLMAAGKESHIMHYDKLNFFLEDVDMLMLDYSSELDPTTRMTVTDEYGDPSALSFIEKNLGEVFKPEDLNFRAEVTQVMASESERRRQHDSLTMLLQTLLPGNPIWAEVLMPMILSNDPSIEAKQRRDIMAQYQALAKQQSDAAQAQAQEESQIELKKLQQGDAKIRISQYEAETARQALMRLNLGGKFEDLPPLLQTSLLNHWGMPAEPGTVMQDRALGTVLDVGKQDLFQQHYNDNVPAWEKEKGSRAAKGVETPKDRKNRAS